jgi:hypothetical protein
VIAANNQESDSAKFGLYQGGETTSHLVCIAAELASHRGVWCYYIEEISLFFPQRKLLYCFNLFRVFTYVLQMIFIPLTINDASVFPDG